MPPTGICPECGNPFDTRVLSVRGLAPPLGLGDRWAKRWGMVALILSVYAQVLIESPKDAVDPAFVVVCLMVLAAGLIWGRYARVFKRPRLQLQLSQRGLVLTRIDEPHRRIASSRRAYTWGEVDRPRIMQWRGKCRVTITRRLGIDERLVDIVLDAADAESSKGDIERYAIYTKSPGLLSGFPLLAKKVGRVVPTAGEPDKLRRSVD